MTDTNALRSAIADSGLKYKALAEIMGLSPYALQMKIDNKTEFKASEIDTLANALGMDMQQRDSIFFAEKVEFNYTLYKFNRQGGETMKDNKKPGEPLETEDRALEIQITQLNEQILCEINGTPVQNVKSYSLVQSSNGSTLLNLILEINAEVVSATIQAPMQPHL
jgi:hypothetical protein